MNWETSHAFTIVSFKCQGTSSHQSWIGKQYRLNISRSVRVSSISRLLPWTQGGTGTSEIVGENDPRISIVYLSRGYQRNCKLSWRSLDLSHCGLVRGENHFHGIQITHIPPSNTLQIFSNGCQEITKRWRVVPRDRVSSSWISIIQPWVKPSTPTSFRWGCFFWRFFSP